MVDSEIVNKYFVPQNTSNYRLGFKLYDEFFLLIFRWLYVSYISLSNAIG